MENLEVLAKLLAYALDTLWMQEDACCPTCCAPCAAIQELMRCNELDDYAYIAVKLLGESFWWDDIIQGVDMDWLSSRWTRTDCHEPELELGVSTHFVVAPKDNTSYSW